MSVIKVKIYFSVAAIAFVGIVLSYYFININTGLKKTDILIITRQLNPSEIEYLMLYPTDASHSIVKDTLFVRNKESIKSLASEISKIKRHEPNHPIAEWNLKMKIKLIEEPLLKFRFDIIQSDEKNGTSIWITKESFWGEFNIGEYRNDNLEDIIISIVN